MTLSQQASPDPAFDGSPLCYTIYLTNSGQITLHTTVTDYLPVQVTPGGVTTWETGALAPGEVWTASLPVTVEVGYLGTLTNTVQAMSVEGASGWSTRTTDVHTRGFLPFVLRSFP